jgi:hypothetical protein
MLKKESDEIKRDLLDQAEKRFGKQRATEIQPAIEVMAEQQLSARLSGASG